MDQPEIIGSQHIVCERCGSRDFRLEDGYYYCTECQLQTQDYQEHVMEGEYGGAFTRVKKIKDPNSESEKSKSQADQESVGDSSAVSSWEILNYVLKGLVDELILLGAPRSLKPIALQLWASYLSQTEIAFTSTSVEAKPKFGIYHRRSDATYFYKTASSSVKQIPKLLRKRKKRSRSVATTALARKIRLNKDKRALARDVYNNESVASSSFGDSQSSFNLSSLSTSLASLGSQSTKLSKSERISYSTKGKSDVDQFLAEIADEENAVLFHRKYMKQARRETVHHATLLRVMAILRIALLISGSNIHVGDMRRWMEEGYLSLECLHKFIPPGVHLSAYQIKLISDIPFFNKISLLTKGMVKLLSISDDSLSPTDLINALVKRYCIMLNLPDTICVGVERLLEMKPPNAPLSSPTMSNYEAKAMGFILFSLKVLIGLDDVTEYVYVPRSGTEGVRWEEWCQQYVARMAKKAVTHHPTLCRLYPNSYIGRDHSLLSHWDPSTGKIAKAPRTTDKHAMDQATRDSINRILTPLVCQLPEPSWKPGLTAEVTRTGPPLIVLSESDGSSALKVKKNIDLVHTYKPDQPTRRIGLRCSGKRSTSESVRIELVEDKHGGPSGNDTITLYPADRTKTLVREEPWMSPTNELPDFNIWIYHSEHLRKLGNDTFDQMIQERLPFSFVWLLGEMSHMIYQPQKNIYQQMQTIERIYKLHKTPKRLRRKKTK